MKIKLPIVLLFSCIQLHMYACSCMVSRPDIKTFITTSTVFIGTVANINKVNANEMEITFKVKEIFKGLAEGVGTAKLRTRPGGGDCGLNVVVGQEWVIWAYFYNGVLFSSICTNSKLITDGRDDISILRSFKQKKGNRWYLKDKLVATGILVNDMPGGEWQFYKNEKLQDSGAFKQGKKEGKWVFYTITDTYTFKNRSAVYESDHLTSFKDYDSNGHLSRAVINIDTGTIDRRIVYWKSGRVREHEVYKDGKSYTERYYHENGQLALYRKSSIGPTGDSMEELELYEENGDKLDDKKYFIIFDDKENKFTFKEKN